MNKSVLIIDTPDSCRECPLCWEDHITYRDYCRITNDHIWTTAKPEWCPLKPLPEKYDMDVVCARDFDGDYEYGYNTCIDEILGGQYGRDS